MYCKNCGTEVKENSRFCANCGFDIVQGKVEKAKKMEDNTVKIQVKPYFSMSYKFLACLWQAIVWIIFISILVINLPLLWLVYPITFLYTLGIVGIYIAIKMLLEKKQYDDLEYNFYTTKVEYKDGFLNKEEKELKYKYVREVVMKQSVLERMCNLGTIRIYTNASNGINNSGKHNTTGKNGIHIHCVKNVREQYKTIREIIDKATEDEE